MHIIQSVPLLLLQDRHGLHDAAMLYILEIVFFFLLPSYSSGDHFFELFNFLFTLKYCRELVDDVRAHPLHLLG